ncbi:MAG: YncE family protein [Nitrospirota bacterium]
MLYNRQIYRNPLVVIIDSCIKMSSIVIPHLMRNPVFSLDSCFRRNDKDTIGYNKNIRHYFICINSSKLLVLSSWVFALCFFFLLTGCASIQKYEETESDKGQIAIFLKGHEKASLNITFDVLAINIMAEDGTYRGVMSAQMNINSFSVAGRQMLLGEKSLPEGRYKKLQLIIQEALIKREDRISNLALPPEGIEIDIDIIINKNQSASLFLSWRPDASIVDGYLFSPVFDIKGEVPELSSLLIYVTNEESNNVSVLNRQTGDVAATIMVGKKPRGIAANWNRERPRIYVANSGSNSVSVIDPHTNKVEVEIPIRFGREPEAIAVVSTSRGKEFIFVANYASDTISVIDASTYQEIQMISVGDGPVAVAVDPPVDIIFGSRFLSIEDISILRSYREKFFNVYVVNKNSKEVSILRMDASSVSSPDAIINVNVEWNPIALTVDYQRGKVYVANYNFDNLSVIDILQIIKGNKTGAVSSITNVGTSITGIVTDPDLDRIYLLKDSADEIIIIRPFSEAFSSLTGTMTMAPLIGVIPAGDSPRSLILDPEGRKIYVVNRGSDTVSEIDKNTRKEERIMPVGRKPYGIAMFPF